MNFKTFFHTATGHQPYPYQEAFATTPELPHLLEVPTGAGKTATAVLGWLWRRTHGSPEIRASTGRRLVFCLPMRSLVEQTQRESETWLAALNLQHIKVHTLMGGAIARDWDDRPEFEAIIVGTQDQLLSRALNRGYAMSRFRWPIHFGWLNNDCLWVMDEVQLMGSGLSTSAQLEAFRSRFGVFGPSHTVWMSATLAPGALATIDLRRVELRHQGLGEGDRAALRERLRAKKSIARLDVDSGTPAAIAKHILELHESGTLTLVVVNRVARARDLAQALRKAAKQLDVALIHSRFRPCERKAIQAKALAPGWSGVLVATQAIEAGIDIDARVLVTDLAAWSAMIQRFGRCNRAGKRNDARISWMDVRSKDAAPYQAEELDRARGRLLELDDVGPESLAQVAVDPASPALPVIRQGDLLSLFDTQSDLAGHDVDVSPYVRSSEHDSDVQVLWRSWPGSGAGEGPPAELPAPMREELCRAPMHDVVALVSAKLPGWRWSSLNRSWEKVTSKHELYPGLTVLLPVEAGGYVDELGWTGNKKNLPSVVELPADAPANDFDEGDPWTHVAHQYVELATHSGDVVEAVTALRAELEELSLPSQQLVRAARWHDLGKAHAAFQHMLTKQLGPDDPRRTTLWAKSDGIHSGRCERPYFRHELASALAFLEQGGEDLEVYLVAAHHGKVRLAIRSRPGEPSPTGEPERWYALGIWDKDPLPEAELGDGVVSRALELDLSAMKLGRQGDAPSWTERCLGLLDEYGPFKLAYLEALVRIADWRGTRKRMTLEDADG